MTARLMSEPFSVGDPAIVYGLTDREIYWLFFRPHDKEADAEDMAEQLTAADEVKPLDQKRDEYIALCRSFGHSDEQAEAEWQAWLREQG